MKVSSKTIFFSTFFSVLSVAALCCVAFFPMEALAQAAGGTTPATTGSVLAIPQCALTTGSCGICDILVFFGSIAQLIMSLISSIVILMVIIGGVFWISAAGNAERIDRGKQIMLGALIGGVLVFFSFIIVNLVMIALLGGSNNGKTYDIVAPFERNPWNEFCVDAFPSNRAQFATGQCSPETIGEACTSGTECTGRTDCKCVSAYTIASIGTIRIGFTDVPELKYNPKMDIFCAPTSAGYCSELKKEKLPCYRQGSDYLGLCHDDSAAGGWQCTYNYFDKSVQQVCEADDDGKNCQFCTTPGACVCKGTSCVSKCEERVKEITGKPGQCMTTKEECEEPGIDGTVYTGSAFSCGTSGPSVNGDVCCSLP